MFVLDTLLLNTDVKTVIHHVLHAKERGYVSLDDLEVNIDDEIQIFKRNWYHLCAI